MLKHTGMGSRAAARGSWVGSQQSQQVAGASSRSVYGRWQCVPAGGASLWPLLQLLLPLLPLSDDQPNKSDSGYGINRTAASTGRAVGRLQPSDCCSRRHSPARRYRLSWMSDKACCCLLSWVLDKACCCHLSWVLDTARLVSVWRARHQSGT